MLYVRYAKLSYIGLTMALLHNHLLY